MKKIYILALAFLLTACEYDDSALSDRIDQLEDRIEQLEAVCSGINKDIDALQQLIAALQAKDYVTAVEPVEENGKVVGYRIEFTNSDPVVIYHGRNGADGQNGTDGANGYIPQIGIRQDTDGHYYWTLDGKWLLDENGQKISAEGIDGADGQDGSDGADGQDGMDGQDGVDGKDGITPQLKIEEDGYWYVSLDGGAHWEKLMPATGTPGADGADGSASLFSGVEVIGEELHIHLSNGTELVFPMSTSSLFDPASSLNFISPMPYKELFRGNPETGDISSLSILVSPKETLEGLKENYKDVMSVEFIQVRTEQGGAVKTYSLPVTGAAFDERAGMMKLDFDFSSLPEELFSTFYQDHEAIPSYLRVIYDDGTRTLSTPQTQVYLRWYGNPLAYNITSDTGNLLEVFGKNVIHQLPVPADGLEILFIDKKMESFPAGIHAEGIREIVVEFGKIADNAFCGFPHLTYIRLVTGAMGKGVFEGCRELSEVSLELDSGEIPERTFEDCVSLETVNLMSGGPFGLRKIGKEAFSGCTSFFGFPRPYMYYTIEDIGERAFYGCTSFPKDNVLQAGGNTSKQMVSVGKEAFAGCTNIQRVDLSDSLRIGELAFEGCTELTHFIGRTGYIAYIGRKALDNTPKLEMSNVFPLIGGEIGEEAFIGDSRFVSIFLDCRKIGRRAFYGCPRLGSINLNNPELESVGDEAFFDCPRLTGITLTQSEPFPIGVDVFPQPDHMTIFLGDESWRPAYEADPAWAVYSRYFQVK